MKTQCAPCLIGRCIPVVARPLLPALGIIFTLFLFGSALNPPQGAAQTAPLTIDTTNNRVGILTEAPQYPLEVTGAAKVSSSVGVGRSPGSGAYGARMLEVQDSVGAFGSSYEEVRADGAGFVYVHVPYGNPGSVIGLYANPGSLPGYPSNNYPTLKVSYFPYLYFSVGGYYSAYMDTNGVLHQMSTRDRKENFTSLNTADLVSKIEALPITRWNYKGDDPSVTHIGPVAEDFNSLFGFRDLNPVGVPSIATSDVAGVALVGVQALAQRVKAQEQEIADLKARLELLEQALNARP